MKKLNKDRLAKLVFWAIHIVAVGAVSLGTTMFIYKMSKNNTNPFDNCILEEQGKVESVLDYCYPYLEMMDSYDSYNDTLYYSFVFGIGTLVIYWIIRWLYKYLFTEEKGKEK